MNIQSLKVKSLIDVTLQALALVMVLTFVFLLFEPVVTRSSSATDEFLITQEIGDEISFLVTAADVNMVGAIGGLTGGHATGTTYAVVETNSATGYVMDISFDNSPAMLGETTGSTAILDYAEAGGQPDYNFTASTSAVFAYTVSADDSADLDPSFLDNGAACGSGGSGYTADRCWKGPSTSDYRIVDRDTAALSGATTTFTFVVNVPSNPIPAVEEDFYTATATLTATTQ